jgi:uncharacterized protein (TIGR02099 family)
MFKVIETIGGEIPKALAFFIIAVGFAALSAQILLPLSEFETDFFSDHVSTFSGRPTSIKNVQYSWTGWTPTLTAQELDILDKKNGTSLIHFPIVKIEISFIQSLIKRELILKSITFDKLDISLVRDERGKISVLGMPPPRFPIFNWLLSQKRFSLIDVTLQIQDKTAQQSIIFTNLTATSFHGGDHQIYGSAKLPEELGQNFDFSMKSNSTIANGIQNGEILVRAEKLDIRKLLSMFKQPLEIDQAQIVDLEGKSIWENSNLSTFDFAVRGDPLISGYPKAMNVKGRISQLDSIWRLNISRMSIPQISSAQIENAINVTWKRNRLFNKEIEFSAKRFDMAIATYLARLSADIPLNIKKMLEQIGPSGSIENITARYQPDHPDSAFVATLGVKNLSTAGNNKYPALKDFSAMAKISLSEGELTLLKTDFTLGGHHHLANPLAFKALEGSIVWQKNKNGNWDMSVSDVSGELNGSAFRISGQYKDILANEAYLNIGVALPDIDAQSLDSLLPLDMLPPKGETWIRELFHKGRLTQGSIAFRGPTKSFPFKNSEGTLVADFNVSKSTIKYARLWPVAREVNGHIAIREDNLYFVINDGTIEKASLTNVNISCKELFNKEKFLRITGKAIAPGDFPSTLVKASPLLRTPAKQITRFILEDDITLHLDMTIPLFSGAKKDISGSAIFDKNKLSLSGKDINLTELSGSLFLKGGEWWGDGLKAILDSTAINLDAKGGEKTGPYATKVYIQGNSTIENLLFRLNKHSPLFAKWLAEKNFTASTKGTLDWETAIKIPKSVSQGKGQKFTGQFKFSSNLVGVKSTLPMPIAKLPLEEKQFSVDLAIKDGKLISGFIDIVEGKDAPIALTTNHKTTHKGLLFRGSFHKLEVDLWMSFFKKNNQSTNNAQKIPLLFDLRTEAAELFGHHFSHMHIKGLQIKEGWDITIEGIDGAGNIMLPSAGNAHALDIRLQHLRLIKNKTMLEYVQPQNLQFEPKDLPPLEIHIDKFMYHGIEFGKTKIAASKSGNELVFNTLASETEDAVISATGRWSAKENGQTSTFEVVANGNSASRFLRQFGYQGTNIKGGKTDFSAKINWAGPPSSFKVKNLNGSMKMSITDGRFKNIDPGSGRIFGLLSLQSLPRRLSLDFNDLFKKGFAFDSISGDFEIIKGYAYTENLVTTGPSAKITIKGKTGLASHDYDQVATVTPALSGSIPVASALFGPIGIGAGAVYYIGGKMFKSIPKKIDKFLTQDYSITGTWGAPIIKKVKNSK